jgi:peptide/nickel transport system substrate-binding protein
MQGERIVHLNRGENVRKRTKAVAIAIVAVLAVTGLVACGGSDDSSSSSSGGGGEMQITMTSFPDYLDPQLSYTVEGWEALYPTYTPLLTYDHADGDAGAEVIPGLAEALPEISADGKTYTLTMRQGMKYSDGTPIKASDFRYAVERMFDLESGGSAFFEDIVGTKEYTDGKADTISGIEANDDTGEITINLIEPRGTLTQELALMFTAPVPQTTPKDKDQTNTPPPSSGAFVIKDVDAPRSFVMEPNPQFSTVSGAGADLPAAKVDKITATQNKSNSAQVTGVEQNTIDFMLDPPDADRLPEVEAQYSDRFEFEDSINTYYFWLNTQEPPFSDLKVRQAVNYAIDPEALNRIFGGRLNPTQQILPPGMPGYEEYTLYPGPDLAKAQALLAEANPADKDITVWTDDEPDRKRIGEYYQDLLNQIGFNADLKIIAGDVYFQTIGNENTPDLDTGFSDWFQDYPHPNDFFDPLLNGESIQPSNNNNFSLADIPDLNQTQDELATKQLEDGDVISQYAALDKSYMEQAVWAPYGNEKFTVFVSDRVNFDALIPHIVMTQDYSAFELTD